MTPMIRMTFEVMGQYMETHLGAAARQPLGQEMGRTHSGFERAEGMSDGWLRSCIASGIPSRRSCIVSRTASCFQRKIRR